MGIKCRGSKCYYYGWGTRTCDYCYLTGHMRGCYEGKCDKYNPREKGDKRTDIRLPPPDSLALSLELSRESIWEADQLIRDYAKRHSD